MDRLLEVEQRQSTFGNLIAPLPTISVFAISVEEVIYSDHDRLATHLTLGVSGGREGDDARTSFGTLPVVGETYLLFLEDLSQWRGKEDYYTAMEFGRFLIDDNRRVVPNGYEHAPGVLAVSGIDFEATYAVPRGEFRDQGLEALARTPLDEAADTIRDAATRASPVPTQPYVRVPSTTPVWHRESVREVVELYRISVVAEVLPKSGEFAGHSIFPLEVRRVISGEDVADDSPMMLLVEGGWNDHEGDDVIPIPLRDPPEVGKLYLFLLSDARILGYPGFGAPGYTRLEVGEDYRLIPRASDGAGIRGIVGVTEEEYGAAAGSADPEEAFAKLRGRTVDEAATVIQTAIGLGPVPPYPEWWGVTPRPSGN